MSRRHYLAAARIIREAAYLNEAQRLQLFEELVAWFSSDNPRFDPDRFFAACAIGERLSRPVPTERRAA